MKFVLSTVVTVAALTLATASLFAAGLTVNGSYC